MKIEFRGQGGTVATALANSLNAPSNDLRLDTMELVYPRMVHAELMTHRVFSRCAASSRAIPGNKMLLQLGASPVRFGKNQRGMQDTGEEVENISYCKDIWSNAQRYATDAAKLLEAEGVHKQVYNRLTEPFCFIKTVVSATDWKNFFHLRHNDPMVDPTLSALVKCIWEVYHNVSLRELTGNSVGDTKMIHLPYVEDDERSLYLPGELLTLSSARCAATSFRNFGYDLEKSTQVVRDMKSGKIHASAFEHQAWAMFNPTGKSIYDLNEGETHIDRDGNKYSGNFRGFIQHRQLIQGHAVQF